MAKWNIGDRAKGRFDRWLRDYPRATPIGVFVTALVLVGASAFSVEYASVKTTRAADVVRSGEIVAAIERQAATNSAYFQATSALLISAQTVSPAFFRQFAERLRLDYDMTGVVALAWSEAVSRNDLPDLTRRMNELGHPNFRIYPQPPATDRTINAITMVEPRTASNLRYIGRNQYGEARRATAMDRARRTNALAATDPVRLAPDSHAAGPTGFVVFLPVTDANSGRFKGFVVGGIRTVDFIRSAVKPELLETGQIEIFDITQKGEERIFSTSGEGRLGAPVEQRFSVFDQQWVVRYHPISKHALYPLTLVVLIGGISFSLLLLAYILLAQRRNEDLLALVDAQAAREAERAALVRELNHRVKNSLSNVTSIIALTRRSATDIDVFANSLMERVRALAASHSLLDGAEWGPTDLKALVEAQLSSHDHAAGRIITNGPNVLISPNDALSIGLALHELLTNATRYGALSTDTGRVSLRWQIIDDNMISVQWEEQGGPTVSEPTKRGFGLNLIQRALAHELGSPIKIEFPPSGLRCEFAIPMRMPKSFRLRREDPAST